MSLLMTHSGYSRAAASADRGQWKQLRQSYYSQFFAPTTVDQVRRAFDEGTLPGPAHRDPDTISFTHWAALVSAPARRGPFQAELDVDRAALTLAGENVTLAVLVSIAKAAATTLGDRPLLDERERAAWEAVPTSMKAAATSEILVEPGQHIAWVKLTSVLDAELTGRLASLAQHPVTASTPDAQRMDLAFADRSGPSARLRRLGIAPVPVAPGTPSPAGTIDRTGAPVLMSC